MTPLRATGLRNRALDPQPRHHIAISPTPSDPKAFQKSKRGIQIGVKPCKQKYSMRAVENVTFLHTQEVRGSSPCATSICFLSGPFPDRAHCVEAFGDADLFSSRTDSRPPNWRDVRQGRGYTISL